MVDNFELIQTLLKFKALIPTKSGFHLITTPFDMSTFAKQYPNIDVHKNNPTLLYFKG